MNENKLRSLFDYQRFAPNKELQELIAETESRYSGRYELADEEQELITAAMGISYDEENLRKDIKI